MEKEIVKNEKMMKIGSLFPPDETIDTFQEAKQFFPEDKEYLMNQELNQDIKDINQDINDLKSEYKQLSRHYHPDKKGDPTVFTQIGDAYEIMKKKKEDELRLREYLKRKHGGGWVMWPEF